MFRHVVLFRFTPESTTDQHEAVVTALADPAGAAGRAPPLRRRARRRAGRGQLARLGRRPTSTTPTAGAPTPTTPSTSASSPSSSSRSWPNGPPSSSSSDPDASGVAADRGVVPRGPEVLVDVIDLVGGHPHVDQLGGRCRGGPAPGQADDPPVAPRRHDQCPAATGYRNRGSVGLVPGQPGGGGRLRIDQLARRELELESTASDDRAWTQGEVGDRGPALAFGRMSFLEQVQRVDAHPLPFPT